MCLREEVIVCPIRGSHASPVMGDSVPPVRGNGVSLERGDSVSPVWGDKFCDNEHIVDCKFFGDSSPCVVCMMFVDQGSS